MRHCGGKIGWSGPASHQVEGMPCWRLEWLIPRWAARPGSGEEGDRIHGRRVETVGRVGLVAMFLDGRVGTAFHTQNSKQPSTWLSPSPPSLSLSLSLC